MFLTFSVPTSSFPPPPLFPQYPVYLKLINPPAFCSHLLLIRICAFLRRKMHWPLQIEIGLSGLHALSRNLVSTIKGVFSLFDPVTFLTDGVVLSKILRFQSKTNWGTPLPPHYARFGWARGLSQVGSDQVISWITHPTQF